MVVLPKGLILAFVFLFSCLPSPFSARLHVPRTTCKWKTPFILPIHHFACSFFFWRWNCGTGRPFGFSLFPGFFFCGFHFATGSPTLSWFSRATFWRQNVLLINACCKPSSSIPVPAVTQESRSLFTQDSRLFKFVNSDHASYGKQYDMSTCSWDL